MVFKNFVGRCHSQFLRDVVPISPFGTDYVNDFYMGFEFKELICSNRKIPYVRIPLKQIKESEFFVICDFEKNFYVILSSDFLDYYSFKNGFAFPSLKMIYLLSFYETNNLSDLKSYIDLISDTNF